MAGKKRITPKLTTIEAANLGDFSKKLLEHFGDLNKVPWKRVNVEHDFDYGGCYYEGDIPNVELTFFLTLEEKQ